LKRPAAKVTRFTAMCLVIANMIGTGVFTSLGFQVVGLSSGFVVLLLWTLGGAIAFCGALVYPELGTALPRSGGEYAFLSRIYSGPAGFLAAWISMIAGFPAAVALATIAFGHYLGGIIPGLPPTATACVMLVAITAVHWFGIRLGSTFQNTVTVAEVLLIVGLVGSAAFVPWHGDASFVPRPELLRQVFEAPFAISLVFVMFAYSGWNAATYITAEMAEPSRNVPAALLEIGRAHV
jgi:basic amino acid/polyamine antiporter, APA family